MNKCIEYSDMLSAYIDGELSALESRIVVEHAKKCNECSALLAMYAEISAAADPVYAPVPDSLRIGVMDRIMSEPAPAELRRRRRRRIILTRYMPVAACLTVALLAWGISADLFGLRSDMMITDSGYSESVQVNENADMSYGDDASRSGAAGEAAADTGGGGAYSDDAVTESGTHLNGTPDEAAAEEGESRLSSQYDGDNFDMQPFLRDPSQTRFMPWDLAFNEFLISSVSTAEEQFITDHINNASHWITITGDFPAYLTGMKPHAEEILFGWDAVYVIPSGDIANLTDNISAQYDILQNESDINADYAVVFYAAR